MQYLSSYVAAMLVFASFGLVNLIASNRRFDSPGWWEHLIMVAFGLIVAVPLHELGHRVAGAAQSFSCVRFEFGPLEVSRVDQGWRLRIVPVRRLGTIYQVPSSFGSFRVEQATTLMAGPFLSLVLCFLFMRLGLAQENATRFWFWIVNAQMCLMGVLELVPLRIGGVESDGMQLWKLFRGGEPLDAFERDLLADSVNFTPLRPAFWPRDLIRRLVSMPCEEVQQQYCLYLAYIHHRDAGETEAAWSNLKGVLDIWERGDPAHYALEAAYFLAFYRHEVESAREWLGHEPRFAGTPTRLRAEAAVASAEGRPQDALRMIEEAEARLRDSRPCGNRDFELASLRNMREEIGWGVPASSLGALATAVQEKMSGPLTAGPSPASL